MVDEPTPTPSLNQPVGIISGNAVSKINPKHFKTIYNSFKATPMYTSIFGILSFARVTGRGIPMGHCGLIGDPDPAFPAPLRLCISSWQSPASGEGMWLQNWLWTPNIDSTWSRRRRGDSIRTVAVLGTFIFPGRPIGGPSRSTWHSSGCAEGE